MAPSIAVMLGGHPEDEDEEDSPVSSEETGENAFDDLSPKEVVTKKHECMEHFIKAFQDGDASAALKCFEALHALDHTAWDHEDSGVKDDPEEESEEPPMEDDDNG